jgi:two-component system, OmpR family, response regulator
MPNRKFHSVLYVDDDPDICEVVQATLRLIADLDVHTAGSGEQAIDIAYELRPDLVLMDVTMPGLDGPSTFKCMRESALIADIPVIFMTAKVLPTEIAHFLQLGAIGVIGKPFDPLSLYDDVFALWKKANAACGIKPAKGKQSQLQAQVGSLTKSFIERAQGDVVRLRELIQGARHLRWPALKEVERVAHSIHGAGAMFGFPEVSASGGAIERLVEGVLASTEPPTATGKRAVLQQLLEHTERLARAVEAAAGETAPGTAGMLQEAGRVGR